MTILVKSTDEHFGWFLGEGPGIAGLSLPPGGVDERATLLFLRRGLARLHANECTAAWLIVEDATVAGLCGFKRPPDANGTTEIGYGIALSQQRKGIASRAVACLIEEVARSALASQLEAETSVENIASQRVLERNGFNQVSRRSDPVDGEMFVWTRSVVNAV